MFCRLTTTEVPYLLSSWLQIQISTMKVIRATSVRFGQTGTHSSVAVQSMGRLKGIPTVLSPDLLHALSSIGYGDEIGEYMYTC
jgi:hypothetical protein